VTSISHFTRKIQVYRFLFWYLELVCGSWRWSMNDTDDDAQRLFNNIIIIITQLITYHKLSCAEAKFWAGKEERLLLLRILENCHIFKRSISLRQRNNGRCRR
jgi:hypothetical protein